MAKLDFKRIPKADTASGRQDAFELFAREALYAMGFKVLIDPSRGADGGKDLIVEEHRVGPLSDNRHKWLVSCKHLAHGGGSVTPDLERNVIERVKAAGCDGFLGFYSTLPSTGLRNLLKSGPTLEVILLDHEQIERHLLQSRKGREVVQRFFPALSETQNPEPVQLYSEGPPILCENCGKDLLNPPSGNWVIWSTPRKPKSRADHYIDAHFACKGLCDEKTEQKVRMRHSTQGFISDGWDDIPDILVPTVFIRKIMAFINGFAEGDTYEPEALDKVKTLLLLAFPRISRNLTRDEQKTLERLQEIPSYLGGMGYED